MAPGTCYMLYANVVYQFHLFLQSICQGQMIPRTVLKTKNGAKEGCFHKYCQLARLTKRPKLITLQFEAVIVSETNGE